MHSAGQIAGIRKAAQATAWVRERLAQELKPGMTTLDVDQLAAVLIAQTGGTSAFHNYRGFPGQICISVNDEVVHGIGQAGRVIEPGDLVSVDVGVRLDGFIGDTATSVCAGLAPTGVVAELMAVTQEGLQAGVAAAVAGGYVGDIGAAVETVVRDHGFSVVRDFVGHGCGCELHEPPEVPNFATLDRGAKLRPGMVLAIEPMVNVGSHDVMIDADGWTVRTGDQALSAHYEHMVLIAKEGPEILTWPTRP